MVGVVSLTFKQIILIEVFENMNGQKSLQKKDLELSKFEWKLIMFTFL